jgi:hypothetical protein
LCQNGNLILITQHLDLLPFDQFVQFRHQLANRALVFDQLYPRRLLTGSADADWLLGHFQATIDQHGQGWPLQQIFVSLELSGAYFMMHRSHPNIQRVLVYSPYDNIQKFQCAIDPAPDAPDYWNPSSSLAVDTMTLCANSLAVIDAAQQHHWGQAAAIAAGQAQQLVWIYLG